MKYYFLMVPTQEFLDGKLGLRYALANRDKWKQCDEAKEYLAAGYVNGVDLVVINNEAGYIKKTYTNIDEKYCLFVCAKSAAGCDSLD